MRAVFLLSVLMFIMTSCNMDAFNMMSQSTRKDVFHDIKEGAPIPSGYAELTIVSSLKTHKPGIYPFGSKVRGTPEYVLSFNLDGQNEMVKGFLSAENREKMGLYDPEAGVGVRYLFEKTIFLKAGAHSLMVSLPEEKFIEKRELDLKDATSNTLRLEPIYGQINPECMLGVGQLGCRSFMAGIVGFWAYLNGSRI